MLVITFVIYYEFNSVEKVSGRKEKNIRYLHLVEGLIITILGILILKGVLH